MSAIVGTYGAERRDLISDQFRNESAGEGGATARQSLADRRIAPSDDPLADRRKDSVQISSEALAKYKEQESTKMEITAIMNGTDEEKQGEASGLMHSTASDSSGLKKAQNSAAGANAQAASGGAGGSTTEEVQKQLKEAQKRLAEAQEKLSQAQQDASKATTDAEQQAANAKVQAAQQEVSAIQSEISTLTSELSQ